MTTKIRKVKIFVWVETNKATHKKEFDNIEDAQMYLEDILDSVEGD